MSERVVIGSVTFEMRPCLDDRIIILVEPDRDEPTYSREKWQSILDAAALISIAERRAEADRLEIARIQVQRDEARHALSLSYDALSKLRTGDLEIGYVNERVDRVLAEARKELDKEHGHG